MYNNKAHNRGDDADDDDEEDEQDDFHDHEHIPEDDDFDDFPDDPEFGHTNINNISSVSATPAGVPPPPPAQPLSLDVHKNRVEIARKVLHQNQASDEPKQQQQQLPSVLGSNLIDQIPPLDTMHHQPPGLAANPDRAFANPEARRKQFQELETYSAPTSREGSYQQQQPEQQQQKPPLQHQTVSPNDSSANANTNSSSNNYYHFPRGARENQNQFQNQNQNQQAENFAPPSSSLRERLAQLETKLQQLQDRELELEEKLNSEQQSHDAQISALVKEMGGRQQELESEMGFLRAENDNLQQQQQQRGGREGGGRSTPRNRNSNNNASISDQQQQQHQQQQQQQQQHNLQSLFVLQENENLKRQIEGLTLQLQRTESEKNSIEERASRWQSEITQLAQQLEESRRELIHVRNQSDDQMYQLRERLLNLENQYVMNKNNVNSNNNNSNNNSHHTLLLPPQQQNNFVSWEDLRALSTALGNFQRQNDVGRTNPINGNTDAHSTTSSSIGSTTPRDVVQQPDNMTASRMHLRQGVPPPLPPPPPTATPSFQSKPQMPPYSGRNSNILGSSSGNMNMVVSSTDSSFNNNNNNNSSDSNVSHYPHPLGETRLTRMDYQVSPSRNGNITTGAMATMPKNPQQQHQLHVAAGKPSQPTHINGEEGSVFAEDSSAQSRRKNNRQYHLVQQGGSVPSSSLLSSSSAPPLHYHRDPHSINNNNPNIMAATTTTMMINSSNNYESQQQEQQQQQVPPVNISPHRPQNIANATNIPHLTTRRSPAGRSGHRSNESHITDHLKWNAEPPPEAQVGVSVSQYDKAAKRIGQRSRTPNGPPPPPTGVGSEAAAPAGMPMMNAPHQQYQHHHTLGWHNSSSQVQASFSPPSSTSSLFPTAAQQVHQLQHQQKWSNSSQFANTLSGGMGVTAQHQRHNQAQFNGHASDPVVHSYDQLSSVEKVQLVSQLEGELMECSFERDRTSDAFTRMENQKLRTQAELSRRDTLREKLDTLNKQVHHIRVQLRNLSALHR